jgi:hypothetical protein
MDEVILILFGTFMLIVIGIGIYENNLHTLRVSAKTFQKIKSGEKTLELSDDNRVYSWRGRIIKVVNKDTSAQLSIMVENIYYYDSIDDFKKHGDVKSYAETVDQNFEGGVMAIRFRIPEFIR